MYNNGSAGSKNYIEAYKWFTLSNAHKQPLPSKSQKYLKKYMSALKEIMTHQDLEKAQFLIDQFKPQKNDEK